MRGKGWRGYHHNLNRKLGQSEQDTHNHNTAKTVRHNRETTTQQGSHQCGLDRRTGPDIITTAAQPKTSRVFVFHLACVPFLSVGPAEVEPLYLSSYPRLTAGKRRPLAKQHCCRVHGHGNSSRVHLGSFVFLGRSRNNSRLANRLGGAICAWNSRLHSAFLAMGQLSWVLGWLFSVSRENHSIWVLYFFCNLKTSVAAPYAIAPILPPQSRTRAIASNRKKLNDCILYF